MRLDWSSDVCSSALAIRSEESLTRSRFIDQPKAVEECAEGEVVLCGRTEPWLLSGLYQTALAVNCANIAYTDREEIFKHKRRLIRGRVIFR